MKMIIKKKRMRTRMITLTKATILRRLKTSIPKMITKRNVMKRRTSDGSIGRR